VVRGLLELGMSRKAELILLKGPPMGNSRVQQEAMAKILRRRSEVLQTQAKEDSTTRVAETRRVVLGKPVAHYRPR